MRWRALGAALCATIAVSALASAAEPTPAPAAEAKPTTPAESSPKRKLPDYGNRGKDPTTVGDVAIWVPRVILSPVYLVTEYGIRWPLGHLISAAERANLPSILYDFFFFGPNHSVGVAPVAFVDFGFRPSIGLFGVWNDAGFKGHDLSFHGTTGGSEWFAGAFTDRIAFHGDDSMSLSLTGLTRPDRAFFGIGPDSLQDNISRYGEKRFEADAITDFKLWRASSIQTSIGIRSLDFRRGYFGHDPSIQNEVAKGAYALPPGFEGYTAQTSGVRIAFDSRLPRPAEGSGVRVELEAEQGTDVRHEVGAAWLRYSGTVGGFLDLNGRNRVVSLSLATLFADSLNKRPVPFTELVQLGGPGPMRGFYPGRLRDNSAAVVTAKYRWPIWVWLDGSLQTAVGNVFGEHLEHLDLSRSRLSTALGVESVGSRDSSFELLVGFGTETFDHGGQIDSVRVLIGSNSGF
jgi:hypothetical protein